MHQKLFPFRGWIGGSGALTVSAGITFVYVLGAVTTWRIVCAICGTIPILVAIMMPFLPETPNWLVANGRKGDAYKVKHDTHLITGIENKEE